MQTKKSFDKDTCIKILKGALIAATGGFALYFLDAMGKIDFGSTITPFIAVLIPVAVNAIKEFLRGESEPLT